MQDEQVYVLDRDAMMRLWLSTKVAANQMSQVEADKLWRRYQTESRFVMNYFSTATDAALLAKLAKDLGSPIGRVYFKNYGGKQHIVFKGHAGLRRILNGTRYGVQNAKVVNMGLGRAGVKASARGGAIVSIFLLTAWNIADYVMRDEATLGGLLGAIGADIVKVAIGSAIGATAGALAVGTAIGTFALGPLAVAVVVGVGAGLALDWIDNRFQLTAKLQKMLDDSIAKLQKRAQQGKETLIEAGLNMATALASRVIDLAVDYAHDAARRQLDKLTWRFLPRF
ncbi:hypothetical protein DMC47_10675 [Nostoc sp. 3335mG]|nr:hypothetical protein DMC47_10675 [Nostoc sp. 3335mG]